MVQNHWEILLLLLLSYCDAQKYNAVNKTNIELLEAISW